MIRIVDSDSTSCMSCTRADREAAEKEIGRPLNFYDIQLCGDRMTIVVICEPCLISLNEETNQLVEV